MASHTLQKSLLISRFRYLWMRKLLALLSLVTVAIVVFNCKDINYVDKIKIQNRNIKEKKICMEVGTAGNRSHPSPDNIDQCLLFIDPSSYIDVLSKTIVGLPIQGTCRNSNCSPPHEAYIEHKRRFGNDWPPYGYSMIGIERMENFRAAINEVNRNKIYGCIMELGVWRGGAMILAAALQKEAQISRNLYLFDAFGELPNDGYGESRDYLAVDINTVIDAFKTFGVFDNDRVHFVKGVFENTTLEWQNRSDSIAVLRVDGNFYDSYQDAMYAMYENVPVGGIVIFDDIMSHPSVMRFWKDFKKDQDLPEDLVQIDDHSAWFRKIKAFKVDLSKKHKGQDVNANK